MPPHTALAAPVGVRYPSVTVGETTDTAGVRFRQADFLSFVPTRSLTVFFMQANQALLSAPKAWKKYYIFHWGRQNSGGCILIDRLESSRVAVFSLADQHWKVRVHAVRRH